MKNKFPAENSGLIILDHEYEILQNTGPVHLICIYHVNVSNLQYKIVSGLKDKKENLGMNIEVVTLSYDKVLAWEPSFAWK